MKIAMPPLGGLPPLGFLATVPYTGSWSVVLAAVAFLANTARLWHNDTSARSAVQQGIEARVRVDATSDARGLRVVVDPPEGHDDA